MNSPLFKLESLHFFETNIGGATIRVKTIEIDGIHLTLKVHPSDVEYFQLWKSARVTRKYEADSMSMSSFLRGQDTYEAPEEREVTISAMGHSHVGSFKPSNIDLGTNTIVLHGLSDYRTWPTKL